MKTVVNRFFKRVRTVCLTLLGFGTTFAFTACYGAPPTNYQHEPFPGELEVADDDAGTPADAVAAEGDSLVVVSGAEDGGQ